MPQTSNNSLFASCVVILSYNNSIYLQVKKGQVWTEVSAANELDSMRRWETFVRNGTLFVYSTSTHPRMQIVFIQGPKPV